MRLKRLFHSSRFVECCKADKLGLKALSSRTSHMNRLAVNKSFYFLQPPFCETWKRKIRRRILIKLFLSTLCILLLTLYRSMKGLATMSSLKSVECFYARLLIHKPREIQRFAHASHAIFCKLCNESSWLAFLCAYSILLSCLLRRCLFQLVYQLYTTKGASEVTLSRSTDRKRRFEWKVFN